MRLCSIPHANNDESSVGLYVSYTGTYRVVLGQVKLRSQSIGLSPSSRTPLQSGGSQCRNAIRRYSSFFVIPSEPPADTAKVVPPLSVVRVFVCCLAEREPFCALQACMGASRGQRATDVTIGGKHASACRYGGDCTYSIRDSSDRTLFAEWFACRRIRSLECVTAYF